MRVITATSDNRDGYRGYELYERGWISPGSLEVNCCPRTVFGWFTREFASLYEMNFRRDFLLRQRVIAGVKDIWEQGCSKDGTRITEYRSFEKGLLKNRSKFSWNVECFLVGHEDGKYR